jgi:hypothetical protein
LTTPTHLRPWNGPPPGQLVAARGTSSPLTLASEGWRLLSVGLRRKLVGPCTYEGSAVEICEQIVRRCLHRRKNYFMTSATSYPEFWARDFGRCVPALLALGFEREVSATFRHALDAYERGGRFALVITPAGRLFDFPAYAPDGFALFVYGLERLGDRLLVERHRSLLEGEAERFAAVVLERRTGLVRRDIGYSEAQDYAIRDSSCYSNSVCFLLQRGLDALGLANPLASYDYRRLVPEQFWDGDHFLDDQTRPPYPSGDAQIMPFWTGLLGHGRDARDRLDGVLRWMDLQGLNSPLPSRYGTSNHPRRRMHLLHRIHPWQHDSVWTCLGLQLLEVLRDFAHPRYAPELDGYRRLVERVRCFPEVLDWRSGELYAGPFVLTEDSMLWAANLWWMLAAAAGTTGQEEGPRGADGATPREGGEGDDGQRSRIP